jgi:hypothetical protein
MNKKYYETPDMFLQKWFSGRGTYVQSVVVDLYSFKFRTAAGCGSPACALFLQNVNTDVTRR